MTTHSLQRSTVLFLPALLFLLALGCRPSPATNTAAGNTNTILNLPNNVLTNNVLHPANTAQPQPPPTAVELQRLSRAFTERYGSYSNQTDYANLENLLVFMTDDFQQETRNLIRAERAKQRDTGVYYGITTRVITVRTASFDEAAGTAAFLLTTLRREAIGSTANVREFSQDIAVTLRKQNGSWRVDGADWQTTGT